MKYRSRSEIVALILSGALQGDATRTRLMYCAHVSHTQLKEYLAFLEEKGLLRADQTRKTYSITKKGMDVLQIYDQLNRAMGSGLDSEVEAAVAERGVIA
jgi:predicted transcriptional regulator